MLGITRTDLLAFGRIARQPATDVLGQLQRATRIESLFIDAESDRAFGIALVLMDLNDAVVFGAQLRVGLRQQIGRASCREGVCQYVSISAVAGSLKKENKTSVSTI